MQNKLPHVKKHEKLIPKMVSEVCFRFSGLAINKQDLSASRGPNQHFVRDFKRHLGPTQCGRTGGYDPQVWSLKLNFFSLLFFFKCDMKAYRFPSRGHSISTYARGGGEGVSKFRTKAYKGGGGV